MKQKRIIDFSAIPIWTAELLRAVPYVAKKIRRKFPYCLLDEMQDIDPNQWLAIRLIWPKGSNITGIGDYRQSIYGFRGSKKGVLDEFREYYDAIIFEMNLNYRSIPSILSIANTVHPQYSPLVPAKADTDNKTRRGTVQNFSSGTLTITGGTIISSKQQGVQNSGVLNIGIKDGNISTTAPVIIGYTYGVDNRLTFNYYDGLLKGITDSITGNVNDIEQNSTITNSTEVINGDTYKVSILN